VLHEAGQVREAQVDDLDPAVLDKAENVGDRFRHAGCLLHLRGMAPALAGVTTTLATRLFRVIAELFRAR
jgi:hypothetical protein